MLRGFWKLSWLEAKIFAREPMGLAGSIVIPTILFVIFGRAWGVPNPALPSGNAPPFNVAVLGAVVIAFNAVQSLVAIMAIYREGGILKRLRSTPLSPVTILGSHVVVKLAFTVISLSLMVLAGRRLFPGAAQPGFVSFTAALLLSTSSILSLGFVIASLVPTARFAQPIGAVVLYPMLAVSGLFFPVASLPAGLRAVAWVLPTTHAVALLQGVWEGAGWRGHWQDAAALVVLGAAFTALSARVFRWE